MMLSRLTAALLVPCLLTGCAANPGNSLANAYEGKFLVGTAVKSGTLKSPLPAKNTPECRDFNAFTAENAMKWQHIQPEPGVFSFAMADQLIRIAEHCNGKVIGHTLVWHQQTPDWVFTDDAGEEVSREVLLARMKAHIYTLVGRYKGQVAGWDVVNEALNDDGSLRDTPWRRIIGDDYIEYAFKYARQADPSAELYYNDYNLYKPQKVAGAVRLVKQLASKGIKVHAVGMQGHYSLFYPAISDVEQSITALINAGTNVAITELDVTVLPLPENAHTGADITQSFTAHPVYDPYVDGLPEKQQQDLAGKYESLFALFLKHAGHISRVTLWGITDGDSWRNNWPIRGRTDYPLLLDREGEHKAAYHAVAELVTPE
ncbi:endo-1,4-beta-xylanase [Alteromonas alba]|nr:endo-1,4-beta-xylanase [Alteromonas alba]|tara:strand:+ start:10787 stop:11908 length:1122 start_codon:yes stop_codon:yes gene_type:complete